MKSRCVVASMAALLLGLAASSPVAATRGELTKRDLKALDRAAHAYFSGNTPSVLEGLVKLVARLDDDQFMAAEAILAGRRMPDVKTLLTRARLTAVRYGQPAQLTVAGAREVVLVLPELQRQVDTILDEVLDEPIMQDPLPQPNLLTEFEKLFWDAHVLENRLQSAAATAGYTQQLLNRVPRRQIEKLSDDQQRILRTDYSASVREVQRLLNELEERQIEFRLQRLALATAVLQDPGLTAERFMAAFSAQVDAKLLAGFIQQVANNKDRKLLRTRLADPGLAQQVARDSAQATQLAGDLTEKSRLLFVGLHWWLRGRYGTGTDVFGLAKSPAAMFSADAQMALYMPRQTPQPTDPQRLAEAQKPVPFYDRRHHYWWAWEDRRVLRSTQSSTQQDVQVSGEPFSYKIDEITTSSFW